MIVLKGLAFYKIQGPVEWAGPPKYFNYSSLTAIEACPLKWQLTNSKYSEDFDSFPTRPSPAAIEGQIVHSIIDKLFKALSLEGLPKFGTTKFRECVGNVDIKNSVSLLVSEHENKIKKHPRGNGFRLRKTCQQMTNQVIRLFKNQYSQIEHSGMAISPPINVPLKKDDTKKNDITKTDPLHLLEAYGAATEIYLKDNDMSFGGIIDLVWKNGADTTIVDYKTGTKDENHLKQVQYYAVLWNRVTGQIPLNVEVRYPGETLSVKLSDSIVDKIEEELTVRISKASNKLKKYPAEGVCSYNCSFCDVRQFCDNYWRDKTLDQINKVTDRTALDVEVMVDEEPSDFGFEGKTKCGQNIAVVYEAPVKKIIGSLKKGDCFRILRSMYKKDPLAIELKPWTEVFFRT